MAWVFAAFAVALDLVAQLGRAYSRLGVDAMLVPAYDFDRDAWSHASMAVLRGVEGGFSVVRAARDGLLTVSDRYGPHRRSQGQRRRDRGKSRNGSAARTRRGNALHALRLLVRLAMRRFCRSRRAQFSDQARQKRSTDQT